MAIWNNPTVAGAGKRTGGLVKEFREFILRGNVVDLAVGIVIGAAFGGVVNSFVKDLITPLIGIFGGFNFPNLSFAINRSTFLIGEFINTVISFVILALVIFFFVVKPVNALMARYKPKEAEAPPATRDCPYCLNSVPLKATRCGHCTSALPPPIQLPAAQQAGPGTSFSHNPTRDNRG